MTLRTRLDRLEASMGQPHDADPLVIHTGVPRADDPHGLVALAPRVTVTRRPGESPADFVARVEAVAARGARQ
ncbi:hypothetical protein Rumeso_03430 [Rubellimicrobium mesophilum DSM 19309]|uniref:Uncharacterized protein n=1 Tax=Rubellimicrobium mesophilum DSM 19309 TaxID=442562 RepID=A0A017HKY9_9RHOB|nr:hypothetical protein [Rubellimicrobium mesophilum]EYD75006.1 hypothetical protein Rumeso_03430 [Rubellimicrobium mesophilum DSM 19309]